MAGRIPSATGLPCQARRTGCEPIDSWRGLIGVEDDHTIVIHRKVNDRDGVQAIINSTGKLIAPQRTSDQPHPQFLGWHREHHLFAA